MKSTEQESIDYFTICIALLFYGYIENLQYIYCYIYLILSLYLILFLLHLILFLLYLIILFILHSTTTKSTDTIISPLINSIGTLILVSTSNIIILSQFSLPKTTTTTHHLSIFPSVPTPMNIFIVDLKNFHFPSLSFDFLLYYFLPVCSAHRRYSFCSETWR